MSTAAEYRTCAAKCFDLAESQPDQQDRWLAMAERWIALAANVEAWKPSRRATVNSPQFGSLEARDTSPQ